MADEAFWRPTVAIGPPSVKFQRVPGSVSVIFGEGRAKGNFVIAALVCNRGTGTTRRWHHKEASH